VVHQYGALNEKLAASLEIMRAGRMKSAIEKAVCRRHPAKAVKSIIS